MNRHARAIGLRAALAWVAASACAGCGLEKAYPQKDTFVVDAGKAPAVARTREEILRVEGVRVAPPFDERSLVFRTGDVTMKADYYNVFAASPQDLLTGELVRVLGESKAFADVLEPGSTVTTNLRLECMITDFYADVTAAEDRKAVCRARFRLLTDGGGRTDVAGDWTVEGSAPMDADTGAAAARALGGAFGECVEKFLGAATR